MGSHWTINQSLFPASARSHQIGVLHGGEVNWQFGSAVLWATLLQLSQREAKPPESALNTKGSSGKALKDFFREEKLKNNSIFGESLLWLRAVLAFRDWSHIKSHYTLIWL